MENFIINSILWTFALYGLFELIKQIIYMCTYTNMKEDGIPFPHMYLACGLDDPLLSPNRKFRDTMRELGVDVTYEEGPGAHEWDFWNRYIKKVLEWLPLDKDSKEGLNSGNVGL